MKGKIENLAIDLIVLDPNQPRSYFDEERIKELADSIKQHGLLQPILVRSIEDGKYPFNALTCSTGGNYITTNRAAYFNTFHYYIHQKEFRIWYGGYAVNVTTEFGYFITICTAQFGREISIAYHIEGTIRDIGRILTAAGQTMRAISATLTPIVAGIIKAAGFIAQTLATIIKIIRVLYKIYPKQWIRFLQDVLKYVTAIWAVFIGWRAILAVVALALGKMPALMGIIAGVQGTIATLTAAWALVVEVINAKLGITATILAVINVLTMSWQAIAAAILVLLGGLFLVFGGIGKYISDMTGGLDDAKDSARNFSDTLADGLNSVIGQSDAIKDLEKQYDELVEKIRQAELSAAQEALLKGLEGPSGDVLRALVESDPIMEREVDTLLNRVQQKEDELKN